MTWDEKDRCFMCKLDELFKIAEWSQTNLSESDNKKFSLYIIERIKSLTEE
jgi:hypothetical protein